MAHKGLLHFDWDSFRTFEGRAGHTTEISARVFSLALFAVVTGMQAIALFFSLLAALTRFDAAPTLYDLRPRHFAWIE